jgi:hypothetical protein
MRDITDGMQTMTEAPGCSFQNGAMDRRPHDSEDYGRSRKRHFCERNSVADSIGTMSFHDNQRRLFTSARTIED